MTQIGFMVWRERDDRDRMRMKLGGQGGEEEKEGLEGDYDKKN